MIAAIVMGKDVLPPPATFDFGILMAAMAVHFPLSIVFTLILAWIVARFEMGVALFIGAGFGLILYLVNFYGFTAIFPWFAMARNWITIFTHIMFGVIAAAAYKKLATPKILG
ncbi:MAG: sodium:proline symporter [Gemmatimonadaceae bacterium]